EPEPNSENEMYNLTNKESQEDSSNQTFSLDNEMNSFSDNDSSDIEESHENPF
ncbi:20244_t:CDS:2, partial [Gigaspora rosea]